MSDITNAAREGPRAVFPLLRLPQLRVLAALMPANVELRPWPTYDRVALCRAVGVSTRSDSVWRAIMGLRNRLRKDAYPGLIDLGLVRAEKLDSGEATLHAYSGQWRGPRIEVTYCITPLGLQVIAAHIAANGPLPPVKSTAGQCVNKRYSKE